jgi:hypothetical protein
MGSMLLKMQPSLFHVPAEKDIVYTPEELVVDVLARFSPNGRILEPCAGGGAFLKHLPDGTEWCEIEQGRDFYAWTAPVDWIVGNPPYSHLLSWIRYSFRVARNVVYLVPLHRVFASAEFLRDVRAWGGVKEICEYGTGADWGFPFGHALGAVHWQKDFKGQTKWSSYSVIA